MLFDFLSFIENLRADINKGFIVKDYEKSFNMSFRYLPKISCRDNNINSVIMTLPFYSEYLSKFEPIKLKVPEEVKHDFDWELLVKLIAASFSSEIQLEYDSANDLTELYITVTSNNQLATKCISELWSFQIHRLYEIYLEEQLKLATLHNDDINECMSINSDRKKRIRLWQEKLADLQNKKNIIGACEIKEESVKRNIIPVGSVKDKVVYYFDSRQETINCTYEEQNDYVKGKLLGKMRYHQPISSFKSPIHEEKKSITILYKPKKSFRKQLMLIGDDNENIKKGIFYLNDIVEFQDGTYIGSTINPGFIVRKGRIVAII